MTAIINNHDESRYAASAGRMLSGMIVLYLVSAGAAAIVAFGTAAMVLILNRERVQWELFLNVLAGLCMAAAAWALLYARCSQMRLLVPLW